ncbi:MAG: 2-dehydro-3-deoxy-6-phosphogalactonate aldolase [Alphaproteobacteria bacterium]|nr:2-dehydro-3-deoxy-6-phosphogalactonate aldolase [Alphaproteobacteria bacterium]
MNPDALLTELPIVAILRGVTPARILGVAGALFDAGIRAIEVPLNSPDAFTSIESLGRMFGDRCLTGAGTVLNTADVDRVAAAGGKLLVTPNTNPAVIARGVEKGLTVMPGFYTPSEGFAALAAGAKYLKLFPAATGGTDHLKAMLAVLPKGQPVYAVGGVGAGNMQEWRKTGAAGFGLGSELFKLDFSDEDIAARARANVAAFRAAL